MVPKHVRPGAPRDEDLYFLRPAAQLAGYEFTPEEWSLVARLRQPTSLKDLQRASGFSPDRVERLLKLLRIADALVIFPAVSGSPSRRVVVRPRPESADLEVSQPNAGAAERGAVEPQSDTRELARTSHTRRREAEAPSSDRPVGARDTLRDSTRRPAPQQIWGARGDSVPLDAKELPPPRPSPVPEARSSAPAPAARSSVPSSAARTSLPLPRRTPRPERPSSAPVAVRKSPLPARRPVEPASQAEADAARSHFEKAQAFAKDHRWGEALTEIERAVNLDGLQAEYEALYGWLLHLSGPSTDQTDHAIDAHLIRALKLDAGCAMAHYYRGMMRKRWGDDHGAEAHLRRALALDPKLVDAAREVRLYDARRERKTPRETESSRLRRFVASLRKKTD